MIIMDTGRASLGTRSSVDGPRGTCQVGRETDKEPGPGVTCALCDECLEKVGMAPMAGPLSRPDGRLASWVPEDLEMVDRNPEENAEEKLAKLARLTAYAGELVDDDYLWFDASARYCRERIQNMLKLLGVKRDGT